MGGIPHQESFPLGCGDKPFVEADEFKRRGPTLGGQKGGGELAGVSSTKGMDPEQAPRGFENRVDGLDAVPVLGQGIQTFEGVGYLVGRELVLSFEAREGRSALDGGAPPSDRTRLA